MFFPGGIGGASPTWALRGPCCGDMASGRVCALHFQFCIC